jgi:hypothetical protein
MSAVPMDPPDRPDADPVTSCQGRLKSGAPGIDVVKVKDRKRS